jgi:hypothetical protein
MSLVSPAWLLLLPLLALAGWRWPGLRLREPLRALVLVALVLALAGLRIGGAAGGDVWVLVDQSASAAVTRDRVGGEWESLLAQGRGREDRLHFVDFAADPMRRERGDPVFRGARTSTRLAGAVRYTLTQLEPGRPARMLVLSDGFSTEPLRGLDEMLRAHGVPLDYRLLPPDPRPDARVEELRVASRVEAGAAVLVELEIVAPAGMRVPWEVRRDGRSVGRGEATSERGRAVVRVADRAPAAGTVHYEAVISPAADSIPDNNRAEAWLAVAGRREVIMVTAFAADPLAAVLEGSGWTVRTVTKPGELAAGRLAGARLVVLNNVTAAQCPAEFLHAVDFWVREQGGALLMAGGRSSFGAGGWFESPVDALLPVSMELRTEHRRLATALAISLDRSGSMAAGVPGGGAKIDLANAGAARAAELLGNDDLLAVYAVDSEPHVVAPLASVGPNRATIDETVRAITSGGGGIYVYQALNAAWADLSKVRGARRHVILFADAADAEEPGDYVKLLAEMREARATVTVIGLGSEQDSDAAFLKDVAERGGGRIFFCNDAMELPAVFAQETVAVARAMLVDESTPVKPTAGWLELAARPLSWLDAVDGYNLTYLREGATAAAISGDRYAAPLVAYWNRGAGRVATVAFPMAGEFSKRSREWPAAAEFVRTLSGWLGGGEAPSGMAVRTTREGESMTVDLLLDEDWAARTAAEPPRLVVAGAQRSENLAWERLAPGQFRATAPLVAGRPLLGAVQVGGKALSFGPLAMPVQVEWQQDGARRDELRALAAASGGAERVDLRDVWSAAQPGGELDLTRWMLIAAAVLVVAEALLTQLGVRLWRG